MKRHILLVLSLVLLIASIKTSGQAVITKKDSIPLGQDSIVKIILPEARGKIQWQKSFDSNNWINLETETNDTIMVKSNFEALYRARVTDGTCLPIYSDTASLIFVKPDVETIPAASIMSTSVVLNGSVISTGGKEIVEKGFFISEVIDSITHGIKIISSKNGLNFDSTYAYLKPETNYYACAYAINDKGQSLGSPVSFTTTEFKLAIVDIKEETDWDYMVIDKDGNYYYIQETNSKPTAFFLKLNGSQNEMTVFFDESGFPEKVVFEDYIFLFGNYHDNYVDIVCISPTGETEIVRNVENQVNWDQISLKNANNIEEWSDVVRWTGRVVGAVPCAAAIAATGLTFGAGMFVAAIPCGMYILKTSADIREEEFGITDGYTQLGKVAGGLGALSNIISNCQGVIDPGSCLIGLSAGALDKWADELEKIENSRNADVVNGNVLLVTGFYVNSTPVANITGSSALVGGSITVDQDAVIVERGVYFGTSPNPELTGTKFPIGSGKGTFSGNLTGLNSNSVFYVKAYASNGIRIEYGNQVTFKTDIEEILTGTFTDSRDGHIYKWVKIGTQVWMAENLAYLPSVSPSSSGSLTNPFYYVYGYQGNNVATAKATSNYSTYGVLYNWPAALTACPPGWHLPSDDEWTTLSTYLAGESVAGGKMKETGTVHWLSPNTGATNESAFSGLPGGTRGYSSSFYDIGKSGSWWASLAPWFRYLHYNNSSITRVNGKNGESYGFSVRCVKD